MRARARRRRSGDARCRARRSACCLLVLVGRQGYIGAGLVEYHHFSQFSHPSGKPQLYAYDE